LFSGAIALGGADTTNTSATTAAASVNGSTVTAPGGFTVQATDHAVITSTPVAASLAGSFGVGAVTLALGEAVAINGIHNTVSAVVDNSTVLAGSSAVKVAASEESSITATPTAVSASISVGGLSVALGGAVTVAKNTIGNAVDAAVVNGSS